MGAAMALDGYSDLRMSRQAMKAELLDAETETALARAWAQDRDAAALHRLITAYMRLAVSMALKFRRYGAPLNDLIQEANLGLMKAAEKFDPERGVRFSTYAVWWIKAGIQDHVMRNWSLVRTGSTASQKSLFFNMRRVQARLTALEGHLGPGRAWKPENRARLKAFLRALESKASPLSAPWNFPKEMQALRDVLPAALLDP